MVCLLPLLAAAAGPAGASPSIDVRLSIKYIQGSDGLRPTGFYSDPQNIIAVIDSLNRAMERHARGYRYVIVGGIGDVTFANAPDSDPFTQIDGDENELLETAAEANPSGYLWRTDAVNVYIVDCCAAGASIPSVDAGYRIVFLSADVNTSGTDPGQNARRTVWHHELGHYFNLIHPWDEDGVADTRPEPSPFQCAPLFGCGAGAEECCCSAKVANLDAARVAGGWTQQEYDDLRYNIMGYMGATDCFAQGEDVVTISNLRLTPGQLDRWTDATRLYRSSDVSGLTFFVDALNTTTPFTGYSADPYSTVQSGIAVADDTPGNIVMIRGGVYPENLLLQTPVTLRACRGTVRIGSP